MSNTNIRELPNEIGDCKNLENLNLNKSQIQYLPESISKLEKLKDLDLSET